MDGKPQGVRLLTYARAIGSVALASMLLGAAILAPTVTPSGRALASTDPSSEGLRSPMVRATSDPLPSEPDPSATSPDPSLTTMNAAHDHSMGSTIPLATTSSSTKTKSFSLNAQATAQPAGIPGLDVSGWQTLTRSNWNTIYQNGARFAYVKATESNDYVSSQFSEQYGDSYAAGLIRGAYHFATPNTSSGASQANYFVSNGGGWSADGRTLPPLLDIEYNPYGDTCYGMSQPAMVSWIQDFSNTVLQRTGRLPAIYSTTDWWTRCTGNSSAFGSNPLFIARYGSTSGPGTLPASWSQYTFWQWADSGIFPGDQDVFNGTVDGLGAFATGASLVQATGDPAVYLLSGGQKHHVLDYTDLVAFRSRLGGIATVSAAFVASIPTGGDTNRLIRDPRDGRLYLLQVDGTKHYFTTPSMVNSFGFALMSFTNLDAAQVDAFTSGPDVGVLFRIETQPEVYLLEGATKRYIPSPHALQVQSGQSNPFVAQMPSSGAAKLSNGLVYVSPNYPVTERDISRVYMAVDDHTIIYLPSFDLASEFAATGYDVAPNGSLAGLTILPGSLSPVVSCAGSGVLVASQGSAYPILGADVGGLPVTSLPSDACQYIHKSATTLTAPLFAQARGQGAVYEIADGKLRHVVDYSTLVGLNGSRPLTVITWEPLTLASYPLGAPVLADGDLVQFTSTPEVYVFQSGQLHHVRSFSTLLQIGKGSVPYIEQAPLTAKSSYSIGADVP